MQQNWAFLLLILIWIVALCLIVAGGILLFIAMTENDKEEKRYFVEIGIILVVFSIVLFYLWSFFTKKVENSTPIWTKIANERLVSLNDNNMVNCKIYARRGYINEDLYYQYMVDVGGGGYVANKVPSNGTTVYCTDSEPRCEWYRVSKKWWIFKQWETRWKLYVPEGTIFEYFSIDLQ